LHALCPRSRLDREVLAGPAATRGLAAITVLAAIAVLAATMGLVAIREQVGITGMVGIADLRIIMGTADTTGMVIRTASALGSPQAGADGDPGGGVRRRTPIIHTRTTQRRRW